MGVFPGIEDRVFEVPAGGILSAEVDCTITVAAGDRIIPLRSGATQGPQPVCTGQSDHGGGAAALTAGIRSVNRP